MKKKRFRAAAAQTLARLGDIEHNIGLATQLVNDALRQGAELVVLPECMDTGYLFDSAAHCRALAERVPDGPFVSAIAVHTRARDLIGPVIGLPLLIPALIATARAMGPLLTSRHTAAPPGKWLAILALYDVVFALLAYAVFDFLLED